MTTYNDIATKQDRAFHARARVRLGHVRYMELVEVAKVEFEKAWNESNEIQQASS